MQLFNDRPHQHVDEDDEREEDAFASGGYAEKQNEVAQKAQYDHPHHV